MIEVQNQFEIKPKNGNSTKPLLPAVLSLFDGMSCGQIALEKAKIKKIYMTLILCLLME